MPKQLVEIPVKDVLAQLKSSLDIVGQASLENGKFFVVMNGDYGLPIYSDSFIVPKV